MTDGRGVLPDNEGETAATPRLLLLNGPPGIGKSTIAEMYAARHPGTLSLDIDCLHRLVGGWQQRETRAHQLLRPTALAMATSYLGSRRDVVLPQYLATLEEIESFADAARQAGARFREFVLLDSREAAIERFEHRGRENDDPWIQHNVRVVAMQGGPRHLAKMYDELLAVTQNRPSVTFLTSVWGKPEDTYSLLLETLHRPMASDCLEARGSFR